MEKRKKGNIKCLMIFYNLKTIFVKCKIKNYIPYTVLLELTHVYYFICPPTTINLIPNIFNWIVLN